MRLSVLEPPAPPGDRRDHLLAGLAALGLLGLFVAVQRGKISTYDSKIVLATARAISEGHLHLAPADDGYLRHVPYSHYGIGMSLAILPLYVLQQALHVSSDALATLTSPLLLCASAALLYLCGRELRWSRRLSLAAALVFGALTMALQISQDLFSEPGVALSTALLVLGLVRWRAGRRSGPWLTGLGIGVGILFRTDSLPLLGVGLLLLPAFVPWRRLRRQPWALLGLALPIVAAMAWTGWYAMLRDGTLIPGVYGGSFTTPLSKGLYGLLLSPGKSLFVYNPFLLLAIPGAVALWRRDRALTALLAVLVMARVLFFARWSDWFGGVAWGPRFLMPAVVPLSLLAVYAASRLPRLRLPLRVPAAMAVVLLAAASAVVSVASVWVWQGSSWNWTNSAPRGLKGEAREQVKTERRNAYFYSLDNNAIAHNLRRMTQPSPFFPLQNLRGGPNPLGFLALATAGLAPLAAWLLARERDPPPLTGSATPEQRTGRPHAPAATPPA